MKTLSKLSTILLLISFTLSGTLAAEIYTWSDKDGNTHFSDMPTFNEEVTTIEPLVNENIANAVTNNSQWQKDYNKNRQAKAKQAEKYGKQAIKNKGICNQLKSQLAIIDHGGRIYVMSPEGERSFKNEAQLEAKKKELTKSYKKTCR